MKSPTTSKVAYRLLRNRPGRPGCDSGADRGDQGRAEARPVVVVVVRIGRAVLRGCAGITVVIQRVAHSFVVHVEFAENLGRNIVLVPQDGQQKVFGADDFGLEDFGLQVSYFQHLLGLLGERNRAGDAGGSRPAPEARAAGGDRLFRTPAPMARRRRRGPLPALQRDECRRPRHAPVVRGRSVGDRPGRCRPAARSARVVGRVVHTSSRAAASRPRARRPQAPR